MKFERLSKYKIKKIIECFAEDLTATSASKILKLNRKTVNRYYNEFRQKILEKSLEEQKLEFGEFEMKATLEPRESVENEDVEPPEKLLFLAY